MTRALNWYKPGLTDQFYPMRAALVQEFVGMLQCEVQALLDEGVTYMQLDSLHYIIRLADPQYRQQVRQAGADPDQELDDTSAADNAALQAPGAQA